MLFYVHHERPWIFFELLPFIFLGILGVSGAGRGDGGGGRGVGGLCLGYVLSESLEGVLVLRGVRKVR